MTAGISLIFGREDPHLKVPSPSDYKECLLLGLTTLSIASEVLLSVLETTSKTAISGMPGEWHIARGLNREA